MQIAGPEEQKEIEQTTRGQATNLAWHRRRKGRITASNVKEFTGKANPTRLVKNVLSVGDPAAKPRSHHMKYGIDNEDIAVTMFEEMLNTKLITHNLRKCGLYVSTENGVLAASPDRVGIVGGGEVIVEVKCLSASREMTPIEAAKAKQKDSSFAFTEVNGCLRIKKLHKYYFQVQMQMALTHIPLCFLVVFTNELTSVESIQIEYDNVFWQEVKEKVLDFHCKHIIPALVIQRFG